MSTDTSGRSYRGPASRFIAKINMLYEETESLLKINSVLITSLKITRGIWQGCSFSGLIYALSIEPMLHNIHSGLSDFDLTCSDMHFTVSAYTNRNIVIKKKKKE